MKIRPIFVVLIVITVAVGVTALCMVDVMPPRSATASEMQVLKVRLLEYARTHQTLPKGLRELPVRSGYNDSIRDEWGRDISYEADELGIVTIRSLGKDGVKGGLGENEDIIGVFSARDAQGRWSNDIVKWTIDPLGK